ncbi:MAG: AgmX/PglI C-terminal domain-containing protein [Myxococcota bacterium]|nr:AgmX/PglI C-terminal domain-containing protein [Myxococcota bacterium]
MTQMIRSRRSAFQRCYETSLRNNPTLAGKVTVEFTIQPSGGVTGARAVENTTGDGALASCIVGVIGRLRWTTGPEDGSVTFSYPFVFAPQN